MATTGETIPEWAMREADDLAPFPDDEWDVRQVAAIARALAAAYARGREDAAKVCDKEAARLRAQETMDPSHEGVAYDCAAAIRAGGA